MSLNKIYSVKNYNSARDKEGEPITGIFSGNTDEIITELEYNKGYHILLKNDIIYSLFGDLDHIPDLKIFYEILELIAEYLNIEFSNIKYCGNNKTINGKIEYSMHFVIPEITATLKQQRQIFSNIKNKNTLLCQYLDIGVYGSNRYWRLPNQTNEIKKQSLSLLNSNIEDHILYNIKTESKNIIYCGFNEKGDKDFEYNKEMIFNVSNNEIYKLLQLLPNCYLDDYSKWIIISNICKGLKCFNIWNVWSSIGENYNYDNNMKIWRNIKNVKYDINYIIHIIKTETDNHVEFITNYKKFEPLTQQHNAIHKTNKYVNEILSYSEFKENQTIILKSCTGTGKTTAIAQYCKAYILENENIKVLSLSDKITLGNQHTETFNKYNINLLNYKDGFIKNQHYKICINSLLQLEHLSNNEFKNYVVFIDEINSFLNFTHNKTITQIKRIYAVLLRLIKNCNKLVLSDNIICENIFEFIKNRFNGNNIFIVNDFQKFQDVEAVHVQDENNFYQLINNNIKDNKPFLFGCDSCTIIEEYYFKAIANLTPEETEQYILITANHKYNIGNASESFKNKFVFYSPSIITAVDFSVKDCQNVFIYIKGNTIDCNSSFQQATRCRNINTLFYYCNAKTKAPKYETLEHLTVQYKSYIKTSEQIMEVCQVLDEETTDININENTFFNLYCYNEYNADIFRTSRLYHFQNILKIAKFKLVSLDDIPDKLDNIVKHEMKTIKNEINEVLFNEFLESDNKDVLKYEVINKNISFLNLPNDNNIITKYKEIITNEYKMNEHLNIIRFLRSDEYICTKLQKSKDETYNITQFENPYFKIHLLRQLEKQFNLEPLDINYNQNNKIDFTNDNWCLLKKVFRCTKDKPTNMIEFKSLYNSFIKNICSSDIISSKQHRNKGLQQMKYNLNIDVINDHILLNQYINPNAENFKAEYIEMFNIAPNLELLEIQQSKSKSAKFELLDFFKD